MEGNHTPPPPVATQPKKPQGGAWPSDATITKETATPTGKRCHFTVPWHSETFEGVEVKPGDPGYVIDPTTNEPVVQWRPDCRVKHPHEWKKARTGTEGTSQSTLSNRSKRSKGRPRAEAQDASSDQEEAQGDSSDRHTKRPRLGAQAVAADAPPPTARREQQQVAAPVQQGAQTEEEFINGLYAEYGVPELAPRPAQQEEVKEVVDHLKVICFAPLLKQTPAGGLVFERCTRKVKSGCFTCDSEECKQEYALLAKENTALVGLFGELRDEYQTAAEACGNQHLALLERASKRSDTLAKIAKSAAEDRREAGLAADSSLLRDHEKRNGVADHLTAEAECNQLRSQVQQLEAELERQVDARYIDTEKNGQLEDQVKELGGKLAASEAENVGLKAELAAKEKALGASEAEKQALEAKNSAAAKQTSADAVRIATLRESLEKAMRANAAKPVESAKPPEPNNQDTNNQELAASAPEPNNQEDDDLALSDDEPEEVAADAPEPEAGEPASNAPVPTAIAPEPNNQEPAANEEFGGNAEFSDEPDV